MNKKQQTQEAGSKGGKATGSCKRRDMKKFVVGRNSAGRHNARPAGYRDPSPDRFLDVLINCREWLRKHEDPWVSPSHFMHKGGGM